MKLGGSSSAITSATEDYVLRTLTDMYEGFEDARAELQPGRFHQLARRSSKSSARVYSGPKCAPSGPVVVNCTPDAGT